jgi:hypothetical protein
VTKEQLDNTNPDDTTMNVSKNDAKSRIDIVTKDNASGASSLFDGNKSTNEFDFNKTDPTNLNGLKGPRGTYSISIYNIR